MERLWPKRLSGLFAALTLLASIHAASGLAEAYNDYDFKCKWTNATPLYVYFKWGPNLIQNPSYLWRLRFSDSVGDWNSQGTKPIVQWNSGSINELDSYSAADLAYGKVQVFCSGPNGTLSAFFAYANSNYGTDYNWNNNFMRSITGHELGHGLGLGHSYQTSLMNTSRDRYTIYTPQQDDRNGLNAMYP